MDDERKKDLYSMEKFRQFLYEKATDPKTSAEDRERYTRSICELEEKFMNEKIAYENMDLRRQEIENQTKYNKAPIVAAIITGVLTMASVVVGKKIDGFEDRRYQEEGYNHEKLDGTIYKYSKHARPRHNPVKPM